MPIIQADVSASESERAPRAAVIVPAYQVAPTIAEVVSSLKALWPEPGAVLVIDDGSTDGTGKRAAEAGADVLRHSQNRGKGEALRTGFVAAHERGYRVAVTVDGDGQHPAAEARKMHDGCLDPSALVLGIRDLVAANAPLSSKRSNRFSNIMLSVFCGRPLADTQCGLRRYPIEATLELAGRDVGYAYEAELLIRAVMAGVPIVELPINAYYPPPDERLTHFHVVRDPTRIVFRVLGTTFESRAKWLRSKLS